MFRYLNRFTLFKTNQINPLAPPTKPPPEIDRNRARIRQRDEPASAYASTSAAEFREPKRIRFKVSDPPPSSKKSSYSIPTTVRLKSSDGKVFEVDGEAFAELSERVRSAVESAGWCVGDVIGVPEVDGRALAAAVEYCEKRIGGAGEAELKEWARVFFAVDQSTFFDLTLAAYHLKMKSLLDLTSQTVTDMMRGKTPLEVNKILNIQGA